ncbi:TetR/AcrR family transcriptional regulator [Streptomyces sp. NPDC003247]|uniref:TetR/AcrR family transcriptional regulator n=1 Tax=Streptomyces sp. NPDC003247 TaxID=3364677 RepID=UPI0036BEAE21
MPLTEDVPVRRRRGVQEEASERRRAQILLAAAEAFSERGFNATSLRDVAGRAQISHTGLLHHYPDKNALLEALLDDRIKGAGYLYGLDSRDGVAFMQGLVAIADRDERQPDSVRLLTTLTAEAISPTHPAHGYFQKWHAEMQELVTQALDDLDRRGFFRGPMPTREAARLITALHEGAHTQWLLSEFGFSLAATVRSQLRLFVNIDL